MLFINKSRQKLAFVTDKFRTKTPYYTKKKVITRNYEIVMLIFYRHDKFEPMTCVS